MDKLNKILCGDHIELLKKFDAEVVDLTVTSPPYGELRDYEGFVFNYKKLANELWRVTKVGGVVVWVVGDQVIDGSESGVSFEQALYFKNIGFNLHDTMIYQKDSISFPETNRYYQIFEYMFIFSKGKPKTINLIKDRKNKSANGRKHIKGHYRQANGDIKRHNKQNLLKEYGVRYNIWILSGGCNKSHSDSLGYKHPATFPEKLANDHILSWSDEGDLVLDPMCGSGTTCKMALKNKRKYVGIDVSKKYCDISKRRIAGILDWSDVIDDLGQPEQEGD